MQISLLPDGLAAAVRQLVNVTPSSSLKSHAMPESGVALLLSPHWPASWGCTGQASDALLVCVSVLPQRVRQGQPMPHQVSATSEMRKDSRDTRFEAASRPTCPPKKWVTS